MESNNRVSKEQCRGCKYFFGFFGCDWGQRKELTDKCYPMCSYYLDTRQHRLDDFGAERKQNEWVGVCNKYEPRDQPIDRASVPTFTRKGQDASLGRKERSEIKMKLTDISICPNCGSAELRTADSRDLAGQRIRTKACKNCKYRFRTIEVLIDDLAGVHDMEDDGK